MVELDNLTVMLDSGREITSESSPAGLRAVQELEALSGLGSSDLLESSSAAEPGLASEEESAESWARSLAASLLATGKEENCAQIVMEAAERLKQDEAGELTEKLELTENQLEIAEEVRKQLLREPPSRFDLPPPPQGCESREARAARLPLVAALDEVRWDGRVGLGSSEAARELATQESSDKRARPSSMTLSALLEAAKTSNSMTLGSSEVNVQGVADVAWLARPGDLLVLKWPSDDELARYMVVDSLSDGLRRGISAACLLSDASPEEAQKLFQELKPEGLETLAVLPSNSSGSAPSVASCLAKAFYGRPKSTDTKAGQVIAVVGSIEAEVRAAAWYLAGLLDLQGVQGTSLLSHRCSLLEHNTFEVGSPLTPCVVQEFLLSLSEPTSEVRIVEVLPSAHEDAFDLVDFDLTLVLSTSPDSKDWPLRSRVIQQTPAGQVVSDWADGSFPGARFFLQLPARREGKDFAGQASKKNLTELAKRLDLEELSPSQLLRALGLSSWSRFEHAAEQAFNENREQAMAELNKNTKAVLLQMLADLGINEKSSLRKKDLIEKLLEARSQAEGGGGSEEEAEEGFVPAPMMSVEMPQADDPTTTFGTVERGTTPGHLQLWLTLPGESSGATVQLPLMGASSATGAMAAIAAFLALSEQTGRRQKSPEEDLEWLRSSLPNVLPPPGALEVLAVSNDKSTPGAIGVLQEASSPREVREALQQVREWMHLGSDDSKEVPELTAVFGCQGETLRGDRAKYGWALAEFCDRVILTTDQPRAEPPLQVLEDVLEAMKGRADVEGPYSRPSTMGLLRAPPATGAVPMREVHVVADRCDAVKLGACCSSRESQPGILVFFGSSFQDVQKAADEDGEVRNWLCNDRMLLQEALAVASQLVARHPTDVLDISHVPWGTDVSPGRPWNKAATDRKAPTLPGRSLDWTYDLLAASDKDQDRFQPRL